MLKALDSGFRLKGLGEIHDNLPAARGLQTETHDSKDQQFLVVEPTETISSLCTTLYPKGGQILKYSILGTTVSTKRLLPKLSDTLLG